MALTKDDLKAIKDVVVEGVGEAIEDGVTPRLQRIEDRLDRIDTTLATVDKRLEVLDTFKLSDFRDLVVILAKRNVLTSEEAARFHVQVDRSAT